MRLYEVHAEKNGKSALYGGGHFWITALSISGALNKADKFIKRKHGSGFLITKIVEHGTIDA